MIAPLFRVALMNFSIESGHSMESRARGQAQGPHTSSAPLLAPTALIQPTIIRVIGKVLGTTQL